VIIKKPQYIVDEETGENIRTTSIGRRKIPKLMLDDKAS
jgi:hypothetical protein